MASNLSAAAAVENTVLEATKAIEEHLDAEIDKLENLDDDELDRLRYLIE
jgi:demethoxyubiquinone hydroxylase (CLK1/Coq7/Cat5 family)